MAKSNYITREGWYALDKELKYLWKEERPRVTQSVSEAAAQGDRSENAEYIYGKKRLREIDRRVRFLSKRLDELKIVDPDPRQEGKVYLVLGLRLKMMTKMSKPLDLWVPMNLIQQSSGFLLIPLLPERLLVSKLMMKLVCKHQVV